MVIRTTNSKDKRIIQRICDDDCDGVGSAHGTEVDKLVYAAATAFSFLARRDLVRDALLRWMTPLRAAISRSVIVFFTAS